MAGFRLSVTQRVALNAAFAYLFLQCHGVPLEDGTFEKLDKNFNVPDSGEPNWSNGFETPDQSDEEIEALSIDDSHADKDIEEEVAAIEDARRQIDQEDACLCNPCENSGTCIRIANRYRCSCIPGFTGHNCEKVNDQCSKGPCKNNATCTPMQGGYVCHCLCGYTGPQCDQLIDHCSSDACLNGGTCINKKDGFTCLCPGDYTGRYCSEALVSEAGDPALTGTNLTTSSPTQSTTSSPITKEPSTTNSLRTDTTAGPGPNVTVAPTTGQTNPTSGSTAGPTTSGLTSGPGPTTSGPTSGPTGAPTMNTSTGSIQQTTNGPTPNTTQSPTSTTTTVPSKVRFRDLISCDFECDLCSWMPNKTDGLRLDWTRTTGNTMSYYTGPSFDHTTARSGFYAFTEASYPNQPNHNATLFSMSMQSDGSPRCIDFYYDILGPGKGSLNVTVEYSGYHEGVFNATESATPGWRRGQGPLHVPSGTNFTVNFTNLRSETWMGDVSIDDIRVWKGPCPKKTSSTPSVLACPIEKVVGLCEWKQAKNDTGDWMLKRANRKGHRDNRPYGDEDVYRYGTWKRRSNKGPRRALSGKQDWFAYFRGNKKANTEKAVLISKFISSFEPSCLRFFAHMSGSSVGKLTANKVDSVGRHELFNVAGSQKKRWFEVAVNVSAGENFQVEIAAAQGKGGTIAIDDIAINQGYCRPPARLFSCDFEDGSCGLMQHQNDDCDWKIVKTKKGKALQWDSKRCHQHHDLYKRDRQESFALLRRELHIPKRGGCLMIDYHLGMHDICELKVNLLRSYRRKEERIYYRRSKSRSGKIQAAFITIPPPRGGCPLRKVELEAVIDNKCHQVNIDKIVFSGSICGRK